MDHVPNLTQQQQQQKQKINKFKKSKNKIEENGENKILPAMFGELTKHGKCHWSEMTQIALVYWNLKTDVSCAQASFLLLFMCHLWEHFSTIF